MGCNFSRHVSEDGTVRADIDCTSINIVGIDRAIKAEHEVWHPPLESSEIYSIAGTAGAESVWLDHKTNSSSDIYYRYYCDYQRYMTG